MTEIHQKLIHAIIQKAQAVCPDALALIGVYGSALTGDMHEKSDLDLLLLIQNDSGWKLSEAFILDDAGIGYDLYCTTWSMLEEDALCNHAHLSKLFDTRIVHVNDENALLRFHRLQKQARALLTSDARFSKSQAAFENAKKMYADCMMADTLSHIRLCAGAAIHFLLDSLMLYHGEYFKKGVKRTFQELGQLSLPFSAQEMIMRILCAESGHDTQQALTDFMRAVHEFLKAPVQLSAPTADALTGTYEEIFSNWRNKMWEAAEHDDVFSSFMNMISCQFMYEDLASSSKIHNPHLMSSFSPRHLIQNAQAFDSALDHFLEEYHQIHLTPKRFANADAFIAHYLGKLQK